MRPRRHSILLAGLGVGAGLGLGLASGCRRAATPAAPPAPSAAKQGVRVVNVVGGVERRTRAAAWQAIRPGENLAVDDELRTDAGGRAVVAIDAKSRVTLTASTDIRVLEIARAVRELKIKRGRISVEHSEQGGTILRVRDASGQAVLESHGGRFSAAENGAAFAVASERGKVSLSARGKTVQVDAGQQSVAYVGASPQGPTSIPKQLLLKVARAGASHTAAVCTVIHGTTTPGAQVFVAGEQVAVSDAGTFESRVAAKPGRREVELAVRDATGREKKTLVHCDRRVHRAPRRDPGLRDLRIKWGGGKSVSPP